MKIAIPVSNNELSPHFGHCHAFAVFTVENKQVVASEIVTPPNHEHGSHPLFLQSLACDVVISGGMGKHAHEMLQSMNIQVFQGETSQSPEELVNLYLNGKLQAGSGSCGHHEGHDHARLH